MIVIEKLTEEEKKTLYKIARKTNCDIWFSIEEVTDNESDYIRDVEYNNIYSLKEGIFLLLEGLDCKENWDNCDLTDREKDIIFILCEDLNINTDIFEYDCL